MTTKQEIVDVMKENEYIEMKINWDVANEKEKIE